MPAQTIADECRRQAARCLEFGSPLYSHLLTQCADDIDRGGAICELLNEDRSHCGPATLPLRFMAAVHRLVLTKRAPGLARYYPSVGGTADLHAVWPTLRKTVERHIGDLRRSIQRPVQTNEVGRSGSLLGGFALVANLTKYPLRLLELGSSAGLNLNWDRYHYQWSGGQWGNPTSPVHLDEVFVAGSPPMPAAIHVRDRAGCDLAPVNPRSRLGVLTLKSCIWADQPTRLRRLEAAIDVARRWPVIVERAGAADWLHARLASAPPNVATTVFHSIVWEHMSVSEQDDVLDIIETAGRRASRTSPLAWLRLEPDGLTYAIRLRIYPGFSDRVVATSSPHLPSVNWLLSESSCSRRCAPDSV